jgi:hypothetical protein
MPSTRETRKIDALFQELHIQLADLDEVQDVAGSSEDSGEGRESNFSRLVKDYVVEKRDQMEQGDGLDEVLAFLDDIVNKK